MKFVEWIKPRFEIINFVVITFLLLLSCFFEFAVLLCVIYSIFVSVFYNKQQILCLYLYLKCFENTFITPNIYFVSIIIQGLFGIFILKYIIELIKNRNKLYVPSLIAILFFLIYIILPNHIVDWWDFLHTSLFIFSIYILSNTKEKISLTKLTIIFSLGLIISCSFSLVTLSVYILMAALPLVLMKKESSLTVMWVLVVMVLLHQLDLVLFQY